MKILDQLFNRVNRHRWQLPFFPFRRRPLNIIDKTNFTDILIRTGNLYQSNRGLVVCSKMIGHFAGFTKVRGSERYRIQIGRTTEQMNSRTEEFKNLYCQINLFFGSAVLLFCYSSVPLFFRSMHSASLSNLPPILYFSFRLKQDNFIIRSIDSKYKTFAEEIRNLF